MRFIKCIRSKLFPVGPNLLKDFRVMSVFPSAFNELRFHMIQLITQLFTHRFTQGIGFTAGKVGQQTRQEHHLLLIHSNTISILQVFLHHRNVILNRFTSVFTINKIRNIIHRTRTIKSIHGNQVLKSRRLQLTQIFLHTRRFKLERTDGSSVTI